MTVLAMSSNQTAWWITLAVGLVVAGVVWFLLERLKRKVEQVDRDVDVLWTMGKRVAQNTSTTYLLQTTKDRGVELLDEVNAHAEAAGGGPAA